MKKTTILALDEFTKITGYKTWKKTSHPCTGKWKGTVDYGIILDNKLKHFISNRMENFERNLLEKIKEFQTIRNNRYKYMQIIKEQLDKDNRIALSENLYQAEIIDVDVETENERGFLWAYVQIRVAGKVFKHIETGLNHAMKNNCMNEWLQKYSKPVYTAGAVQHPDYIFGNVRFSSTDKLYKIISE